MGSVENHHYYKIALKEATTGAPIATAG
ncbi:uncharacterized protein G2W53_028732 [Senna tora]|uniref:Uncharacterized protein n=1 Tax=Senna tora TaxID=362788 RepID=A0A834T1I7_9FABA|nr:uncharacterized protein G2W53_028732 [Senna tora]